MNPEKNPQINTQEKMQSIEDISFEEVPQGTSDAIEIGVYKEDSQETVLEKLKQKLTRENWWLQEEWKKEGLPKEQFTISAGNKKVELFNFHENLEPQEIKEIEESLNVYRNLADGVNFEYPNYLLFPKNEQRNPQSNEAFYGKNDSSIKSVIIYPRAVSLEPYRVKEVSSLKGTLSHELGHIVQKNKIFDEWLQKFGWDTVSLEKFNTWSAEKKEARSLRQETQFPEKCITEYAQIDYTEDICESIVGYIANAPDLDPEKRKFLENIFTEAKEKISISKNEKVAFPKLPEKVKFYKKEEQKLNISFVKKESKTEKFSEKDGYNPDVLNILNSAPAEIIELIRNKKYYHVTLDKFGKNILENGMRSGEKPMKDIDLQSFEDLYNKYSKNKNDQFFQYHIKGIDKDKIDNQRGVHISSNPDAKLYQVPESLKFYLANLFFLLNSGRLTPEEQTQVQSTFDKYYGDIKSNKVAVLEISALDPAVLNSVLGEYNDLDFDTVKQVMKSYEPNIEIKGNILPQNIKIKEEKELNIEDLDKGIKNSGFIIF